MNITLGTKSPFAVSELQGLTATGGSGSSFSDVFKSAVNQVETSQQTAQTAAMDFLANGTGDVHTVALAAQRAELSLEMFQQVRNKFVSAYQEVMKMPM
jgi:flagellar hook-basal body complex protein FliE